MDLLGTAVSGDSVETIRLTRELITTALEPQALVSQLASLIVDILSGATHDVITHPTSVSSRTSKDKLLLRGDSQCCKMLIDSC